MEHAMIFYLSDLQGRAEEMGIDALDALITLQQRLTQAIEPADLGEVDGNEIAVDGSEGSLYVYGPDAKTMLKAALPVICASPLAAGGTVKLRYGSVHDPAAVEEHFQLADLCAARNA